MGPLHLKQFKCLILSETGAAGTSSQEDFMLTPRCLLIAAAGLGNNLKVC